MYYRVNYLNNIGYLITRSFVVCLRQLILFLTEQWNFRGCSLLIWPLGVISELRNTHEVLMGKLFWEYLLRRPTMRWEDKGKVVPLLNWVPLHIHTLEGGGRVRKVKSVNVGGSVDRESGDGGFAVYVAMLQLFTLMSYFLGVACTCVLLVTK
jgi:hypothetical protein